MPPALCARSIYCPTVEPLAGDSLGLSPCHQPGEVLHVQDMELCGYSPLPERILSGETAVGEQSPQNPVPRHTVLDAQTRIPSSSLRLRRSTPTLKRPFLDINCPTAAHSAEAAPKLIPNLQPGEVVDIQNTLRRESSSLPSRGVPERDLSDGRAFSRHRHSSSSQVINRRGPEEADKALDSGRQVGGAR